MGLELRIPLDLCESTSFAVTLNRQVSTIRADGSFLRVSVCSPTEHQVGAADWPFILGSLEHLHIPFHPQLH